YDGVEIMGSEGYLINQFICKKTNKRDDQWGGSYQNRCRMALEIVKAIRAACGSKFIIIFRLSLLDLVEQGSTFDEVIELAQRLEQSGVTLINTGIGWHEARIPTIASSVPHAAFSWVSARLKSEVNIPVITSNRINQPEQAEAIIASNQADMVSMARPFLADAEFVNKAALQKPQDINTCIACNQACLDHVFENKRASCLVNPRACYETEQVQSACTDKKKVLVVGAGPAGLSCASEAQILGHDVTLIESADKIGGQFALAQKVPGKSDFQYTVEYFRHQLISHGGTLNTATRLTTEEIIEGDWDHIVIATGVKPRTPEIPGINHPMVCSYTQILSGKVKLKEKIAVIGAGGIGFDVAEFLAHEGELP
ncbi:MAG: oxidoreductase, partial [bacterium]